MRGGIEEKGKDELVFPVYHIVSISNEYRNERTKNERILLNRAKQFR